MIEKKQFRITVSDYEIADLKNRLSNIRWPEASTKSGWEQGVPLDYLQELMRFWMNEYDWLQCENLLNNLEQYSTVIDSQEIIYMHFKSKNAKAKPLIMTHGWPGSVLEFLDIIDPLINPTAHGGKVHDSFHLVLPTLPGFGFGKKPTSHGWGVEKIAKTWNDLMCSLGYREFYAQGGDWGAHVTTELALKHTQNCKGIHITMPLLSPSASGKQNLSKFEKDALDAIEYYKNYDSGYSKIQSTKPQTIGYALVDSPVAQATWILDKFWQWTDCSGALENIISKQRLLDNISYYWFSKSGASSARLYWESFKGLSAVSDQILIPSAVSIFPKEIVRASERWCQERFKNLVYYQQLDKGGHFAALEQPLTFVNELRRAFSLM